MDRLAKKIEGKQFDWYVAITRGGMIPTLLLAQITDQRNIDTICAKSYENTHKGEVSIETKDYFHLCHMSVLLIDDLCDSGDTMRECVDYLETMGCYVETMVVHKKRHSKYTPTYFLEEVGAEWIKYKYEKSQKIEEFIHE